MKISRPLRRLRAGVAAAALAGCAVTDDGTTTQAVQGAAGPTWSGFARVDQIDHGRDGTTTYVAGDLGRIDPAAPDVAAALAPVIPTVAAAFGVAADELVVTKVQRDRLGMTHVRYQQHKQGLRVVGGELVVHVGADGIVRSVNGVGGDDPALSATPTVDVDVAAATAIAATADGQVDRVGTDLTFLRASGDGALHLTWAFELLGQDGLLVADRVFVDAHTGRVVDRHPQVFPIKNRVVFDGQGQPAPFQGTPGPQLGSEGMPPTTDAVGLAAYDNTGITHDCYQTLYGRDSYDGAGATLTSVVHVVFRLQSGGTTPNNAAWVGAFGPGMMVYGDGDGVTLAPLARALDVTAHELTHAVTSETAQLVYQNESGALNEAMSDIMAAVCEAWHAGAVSTTTWRVGETVYTPGSPGDALRYMANPTQDASQYPPSIGGSRDFYADRYTGQLDNGGVHLNSGIANLAFYLTSEGGTHPRGRTTFAVPALGIDKAGAIYQRALTQGYLTQNSTFAQARTATAQAATDLYGGSEADVVATAWAAVGIGSPPAADTVPPTVAFAAPTEAAVLAAGFPIAVTATDDRGVLRVELAVDGALAGTDTIAPYEFTAAADLAEGPHTLTATAYDAANQATATATVTVVAPGLVCEPVCGADQTCVDNVCVTPEDDGGCCQTGTQPTGALAGLGLAVAALLGRRRRRR
ncbi:MAG: M4 family metallopeptidase [Kofleriaceae bacterium]